MLQTATHTHTYIYIHIQIYRPTSDMDKLTSILEEYHMRQHLATAQDKKFVFFEEAVHHICRAVRVFRQPGRHMLMVRLTLTRRDYSHTTQD